MQNSDEMKYAEMFSKWYSWGSPIGLSVFFINMALALFIGIAVFDRIRIMGRNNQEITVAEQPASGQVK